MDLLGSILGSMTGPPKANEKERAERKKANEIANKMEQKRREEAKVFREEIEAKVEAFVKREEDRTLTFEPMSKLERTIVHDVAEVAGLVAHSFGVEEVDRYSILWKKDSAPCEDELATLRQGKIWDPVQYAKEKEELERIQQLEEDEYRKNTNKKFTPRGTKYQQKFEHLIGTEAEMLVAVKADTNDSYGLVSSELKKDKRSVEQMQADIRAKKRAKVFEEGSQPDNKIYKSHDLCK